MEKLRSTTLIQQKYPLVRKHHVTSLSNSFQNQLETDFLTSFELHNLQSKHSEIPNSSQEIKVHFIKINSIIDQIDRHINRRLENHQSEVFLIVRQQIEKMKQETNQMVEKLNKAIKQKNSVQEIWLLNNEVDYFKSQTYKLFEQNKMLGQQVSILKKTIRQYRIEIENNDRVMQKLKKKCLKEQYKISKVAASQSLINQNKLQQKILSIETPKVLRSIAEQKHSKDKRLFLSLSKKNPEQLDIGKITEKKKGQKSNIDNSLVMIEYSGLAMKKIPMRIEEQSPLSSLTLPPQQTIALQEFAQEMNIMRTESEICQSPKIAQQKYNNISTQTDFSNKFQTSKKKQVDEKKQTRNTNIKNGFHIKSYIKGKIEKSKVYDLQLVRRGDDVSSRYMSDNFLKSKLLFQETSMRSDKNKTSMH